MKYLSILVAICFLNGCSSVEVSEYANEHPRFNVKEFFNGNLVANGIVKNRRGIVIRHFTATIRASWASNVGTLEESFVFSDGERQERKWVLKQEDENTYIATANDVIGGSLARTSGNALFLNYLLTINHRGSPLNLRVDDRMYLTSHDTLINESVMTKFGFKVGTVILTIQKH